jgi:hypothetical protein
LERKRKKLEMLACKEHQFVNLELEERQCEEKLDELRNVERKLNIA